MNAPILIQFISGSRGLSSFKLPSSVFQMRKSFMKCERIYKSILKRIHLTFIQLFWWKRTKLTRREENYENEREINKTIWCWLNLSKRSFSSALSLISVFLQQNWFSEKAFCINCFITHLKSPHTRSMSHLFCFMKISFNKDSNFLLWNQI